MRFIKIILDFNIKMTDTHSVESYKNNYVVNNWEKIKHIYWDLIISSVIAKPTHKILEVICDFSEMFKKFF